MGSLHIAAWLVVALMIAGCAGRSTPSAVTPTSAAPDGNSGNIVGLLVDDEQVPVAGADLWLAVDETLRTISDETGRFSLRNVPAGEQTVRVSAKGFKTAEQRVALPAGETVQVTILLTPIPRAVARMSLYQAEAIIELGVNVLGIYYYSNQSGSQYRDIYYDVAPDVKSAVSGVRWTAVTPLSAKWMYLGLFLSDRQCVRVCDLVNGTEGRSPLISRGDGLDGRIAERGGPLTVNPYITIQPPCTIGTAATCTSNPDAVAQVAQDQRFQLYTGIFFVDPAPPGYTPVPA